MTDDAPSPKRKRARIVTVILNVRTTKTDDEIIDDLTAAGFEILGTRIKPYVAGG